MFGPSPTACAGGYGGDDNSYWSDKRTRRLIAAISVLAIGLVGLIGGIIGFAMR